MKKFVIERALPGAGKLTQEDLAGITATSCNVVSNLNEPYHWVESFVTDDKIFCIHIAESEEVVREHAKRGNFPVTSVYEVKSIIDPTTK
ncbi:MAG: DUF4242 domain-containing protein [Pedobacter sp.]|nr:DUF4242 domain-containing protein [Pedobacter sp.]